MIYCRVSNKVTEALHLQYLHYKSTLRKKHYHKKKQNKNKKQWFLLASKA